MLSIPLQVVCLKLELKVQHMSAPSSRRMHALKGAVSSSFGLCTHHDFKYLPEPQPLCMRIFGILLWTIEKRIFCLLLYTKMQHLWGLKGGKQGHFGLYFSYFFELQM
jgi:hypothetical protein